MLEKIRILGTKVLLGGIGTCTFSSGNKVILFQKLNMLKTRLMKYFVSSTNTSQKHEPSEQGDFYHPETIV